MINPAMHLTLPGGLEILFQHIPAGDFRMGARGEYPWEEPVHQVRIAKAFYLGTFPVTQEQFASWKPDHENGFPNRPTHPAEQVDWNEAAAFCGWLTAQCAQEIPDGYVACLPSEAQWEYACRAGTETQYYTGDGEAALKEAGWYDDNSDDSTQPVGQLQPNKFGLFDMHGNVDEWCRDAWDEHAYQRRVNGVCDPESFGDEGSFRVIRGGAWFDSAWFCRSAFRYGGRPDDRFRNLGFRVCLVPGPCPAGAGAEPVSGGMARRDDAAKP